MRAIQPHVTAAGKTTYKVRFRRADDQGEIKQTSESFTARKKAEEFAKRLDLLGVEGALDWLYAGPDAIVRPTLTQVAEDHFDNLDGVEKGTEETYRRLWARTWGPRLGHVPVDEVTTDAIRKAFKELGAKYAHKSLKNQRGLLSGVLNRAITKKYIEQSPLDGIKRLPAGQASKIDRDMRILTVDEFLKIDAAIDKDYRTFIRFLWASGARWGEAIALQAADLRWPNITIQRAVKYAPSRADVTIGPPKNRKARTITLPSDVRTELIALAATRKRDELLFQTPGGARLHHRHFWDRVWQPALEAALGPDQKAGIHDLRHSHVSNLLARGIPIHVVSERIGHSSIKITVDTYGHLQPDAMKWAAQAAQMAFEPSPEMLEIEAKPDPAA